MPTQKNRIQSYISNELYEKIKGFSDENDLTMSSAIEDLLEFALSRRGQNSVKNNLPFQNRVISQINRLENKIAGIEYEIFKLKSKDAAPRE